MLRNIGKEICKLSCSLLLSHWFHSNIVFPVWRLQSLKSQMVQMVANRDEQLSQLCWSQDATKSVRRRLLTLRLLSVWQHELCAAVGGILLVSWNVLPCKMFSSLCPFVFPAVWWIMEPSEWNDSCPCSGPLLDHPCVSVGPWGDQLEEAIDAQIQQLTLNNQPISSVLFHNTRYLHPVSSTETTTPE